MFIKVWILSFEIFEIFKYFVIITVINLYKLVSIIFNIKYIFGKNLWVEIYIDYENYL